MEITFVTGNKKKFEIAQEAFLKSPFTLVQENLETPEIQSLSLAEVASFSARWACEKLNKPVFVTDAGYDIPALKGFPGPFIKYINSYLSATDLLQLMKEKEDRTIIHEECLAYCEPRKEPILFSSKTKGSLAQTPGKRGPTPITELFIPDGHTSPESDLSPEEQLAFWKKSVNTTEQLIEYLKQ